MHQEDSAPGVLGPQVAPLLGFHEPKGIKGEASKRRTEIKQRRRNELFMPAIHRIMQYLSMVFKNEVLFHHKHPLPPGLRRAGSIQFQIDGNRSHYAEFLKGCLFGPGPYISPGVPGIPQSTPNP